jgi:nitroreductase
VGRQSREALADISIDLKASRAGGPLDETTVESIRRKILNPGQLVVVTQSRDADPERAREDYAAVSCAVQNMMLSLHADGLGSKWSTGAVTRDPRTYDHLGVDPSVNEIVGFVWVGKAGKDVPKVKRRRALDDIVRELP